MLKRSAINKKMMIMFFAFLALVLVLCARLFILQIIHGAEYKEKASSQQMQETVVEAQRGSIYDCNGKILAQSATAERIEINPVQILRKNKEELDQAVKRRAAALEEGVEYEERPTELEIMNEAFVNLLGKDSEWLNTTLEENPNRQSVIVARKVEKDISNQLRELGLTGVYFSSDSKRYYPYSNFASHVLGFTGADNNGLEGIEKTLDEVLSGKNGRIQSAKDARSIDMPYRYESYQAASDGLNVVLTIDEVIQHYAEKYLQEAYVENGLKEGGSVIVMNPKTCQILAMACVPNYNPNSYNEITDENLLVKLAGLSGDAYNEKVAELRIKMRRNKAVVDSYEPGSTFKTIVAAAALEEGVISANSTFNCPGFRTVGGRVIHCWKVAGHGNETLTQALQNSCNAAFMDVGARLGKTKFLEYFKAFGMNEKTGFILPGEQSGVFHAESSFNEVELATASFGQRFNVTPLQMIRAFSAVINGGNLMRPQIVKEYVDADGNTVETFEPQIVRRVISEETSATMRSILEGVVADGTGSGAYVKGFRIGGKTGTSEKGLTDARIASFIGFAPADDPEIICLVMLDEPSGAVTGGGALAAPVAGRILEDTLRYLGYEPEYSEADSAQFEIGVPDVCGISVAAATERLRVAGLSANVKGGGESVVSQLPRAGAMLSAGAQVILYTEGTDGTDQIAVPSLIGIPAVTVKNMLDELGLNIKMSGIGINNSIDDPDVIAVRQSPAEGTMVEAGTIIYVDFADNNAD